MIGWAKMARLSRKEGCHACYLAMSNLVAISLAIHAAATLVDGRQLSEREELVTSKQAVHAYISSALADRRSRAADARAGSLGARGIVYPAGGEKQLANAWVSLSILRHHYGCTLPVELVYNGKKEMPHNLEGILKRKFANLSFIDISKLILPQHHRRDSAIESYVVKAAALYATSFDEVLMLDCDSTPVTDPALLFEDPSYLATGNIFWPDFATDTGPRIQPEVFTWLGLRVPWIAQTSYRSTESGQIVFNRKMHMDVLEYLLYLNLHSHILYSRMHGDAGTMQIAFMLAGKDQLFNQIRWAPRMALAGAITLQEEPREQVYPLVAAVQQDPHGEPAFLHRVTPGAKYDPTRAETLDVAYITTPLRAELFFKTQYGDVEPFGGLHKYSAKDVDTEVAGKKCKGDIRRCEEITAGQGITALPVGWFPAIQEVLLKSNQYFREAQTVIMAPASGANIDSI